MPLLTGVIDPIPHDEDVFNLEPYVIRDHVNFGTARFAKQTRGLQAGWTSRPKKSPQVRKRQSGVHDVNDNDDVAAVKRNVEILHQLQFSCPLRGRAITR